MKIIINMNELLFDIRKKNELETSGMTDAEQRYLATAGTEKEDELIRDVQNAAAQVSGQIMRFLSHRFFSETDNSPNRTDAFVYEFFPAERRQVNKIPAMADILHSLIVNLALARFYESVSQPNLANVRKTSATEDMAALRQMLYEKTPPIVPTREDYGE